MDVLIKVAAVCVAGSVLGLVIKKNSPEMAMLLTIALSAFALTLALSVITEVVGFVKSLSDTAGISPAVITVVLKTIGIAIITKLAADTCKDAGQSSVASGVETAGAVTAVYVALPLFKSVVSMITSLV